VGVGKEETLIEAVMVHTAEQMRLAMALKEALLDAYDPEAIILFGSLGRGDADEFRVEPAQLIDVTRKVDAASVSALAGNVPVIIRFTGADGKERKVRLHPENTWTLGRAKSASNALAAALERWAAARPSPPA